MQIAFVRPKLEKLLAALVLALLAFGIGYIAAQAQGPAATAYVGTSPIPIGATTGRLATQVVDATIAERNDRTLVSVAARFEIENTDQLATRPITVAFPAVLPDGWMFDPAALQVTALRVNDQEAAFTLVRPSGAITATSPLTLYQLVLNVPADGSATIALQYTQDLGTGPTPTFRFATTPGSRWPGPMGSSRVALHFPEPTTLEQVLAVDPPNPQFDGQELSWHHAEWEPKSNFAVTFVRPSLWHEVMATRARVSGPDATAEDHYRLAALYRQIAPPLDLTDPSESGYRELILAELEETLRTAPPSEAILRCQAHRDLAALHHERAHRPDSSTDVLYLTQVIRELESAIDTCPPSEIGPTEQRELRDGYLFLAKKARQEGRYADALQALEQSEKAAHTIGNDPVLAEIAAERRLNSLAWTQDWLQQGDLVAAFDMVQKALRPDDIAPLISFVPRFSSVQIGIVTTASERRITLNLQTYLPAIALAPETSPVDGLRTALEKSAGTVRWAQKGETAVLEVTLPWDSVENLGNQQRALVAALPPWPEMEWVRAILSPTDWEQTDREDLFRRYARYRETIDTRDAERALRAQEARAATEQARLAAASDPQANEEAQALRQVRRQMLILCQGAWRRLIEDSQASFQVLWQPNTGAQVERVWSIRPGQTQEMRLESSAFKWTTMATIAGLGVLSVVILILILSLVARMAK